MDLPTYPLPRPASTIPPIQNPRFQHISRSAAKRESVQLLGSIKDLQLHFSRGRLVEHQYGSGAGFSELGNLGEDEEDQSSISEQKKVKERRPWKEVDLQRMDVDAARREMSDLLNRIREDWGLGMLSSASRSGISASQSTAGRQAMRDTAALLVSTAQAVRRVKTLALTVSHTDQRDTRRASIPSLPAQRVSKGRISISTPSRPGVLPRAVSYGVGGSGSKYSKPNLGPLQESQARVEVMVDLRRAGLEMLAGLRGLEERLRIKSDALEDGVTNNTDATHLSTFGEAALETAFSGPTSRRPSSSASLQVDDYMDDGDGYSFNALAETGVTPHHLTWEDRIVCEGRLYRNLEDEEEMERKVKESVRKWAVTAERTFSVDTVVNDEGVEEWVTEIWEGKPLGAPVAHVTYGSPKIMSRALARISPCLAPITPSNPPAVADD